MPINFKTPGVYIQEINTHPNTIVPVESAVPCFIGFTEKAISSNKAIAKTPQRITSLVEFETLFGGAPLIKYHIKFDEPKQGDLEAETQVTSKFYLYHSLKFYFQNGGGDCYIYSAGDYSEGNILTKELIEEALTKLEKEPEPTLIVIPDAHNMKSSTAYYGCWKLVLAHCKKVINRFAILDIYGGNQKENLKDNILKAKLIEDFRTQIGGDHLDYGAVYWPWLKTRVVGAEEIDFRSIQNLELTQTTIKEAAEIKFPKDKIGNDHPKYLEIKNLVDSLDITNKDQKEIKLKQDKLVLLSPLYKSIIHAIKEEANVLPPSPAMAGVYVSFDANRGLWKAPASIAVNNVVEPMVAISHKDQEDLNVPLDGKAVNAIRSFPREGILVWGARTMDGNSQDWRYIPTRRTISWIEINIKNAVTPYVFEPNDHNTWLNVKALISNFLYGIWQSGGLAGATAEDAYFVNVGLGTTMTQNDIDEGYMIIEIGLAVVRPAEFIMIRMTKQMQDS